jgi:hypothetical protein
VADLIGDDRPPTRRGSVVTAVLVLGLAGYALTQHLYAPGEPPAAAPGRAAPATPVASASPTPPSTPVPTATGTAAAAVPAPWAGFGTIRRTDVDYALGRTVRSAGRTYRLGTGDRVFTMDRAAGGPVVFVQSRGSTLLEQLRPDGSRLVLEAFFYDSRLPQGVAVDPAGRRVASAVTSGAAQGPFGLVVRDLATGALLAERTTPDSYAVRDWTPSGILLEVVRDLGGPPYVWRPHSGRPREVTPSNGQQPGPFLLAASPLGAAWAVTGSGCTWLVHDLGQAPAQQLCGADLSPPASWSPAGARIAARSSRGIQVLDLRTGRTVLLGVPRRVFIAQLVWAGDDTVLAAVHTLAGGRGAVLRCRVGHACRQVDLGAGGSSVDLVLGI